MRRKKELAGENRVVGKWRKKVQVMLPAHLVLHHQQISSELADRGPFKRAEDQGDHRQGQPDGKDEAGEAAGQGGKD